MKRFEPETYNKFQETIKHNAKEGLSILLKFAMKVPKYPEWISTYRGEMEQDRALHGQSK